MWIVTAYLQVHDTNTWMNIFTGAQYQYMNEYTYRCTIPIHECIYFLDYKCVPNKSCKNSPISFDMSVRPSAERNFIKFDNGEFYKNLSTHSNFRWKSEINNGKFTQRPTCVSAPKWPDGVSSWGVHKETSTHSRGEFLVMKQSISQRRDRHARAKITDLRQLWCRKPLA
jgi:hypothetical protein